VALSRLTGQANSLAHTERLSEADKGKRITFALFSLASRLSTLQCSIDDMAMDRAFGGNSLINQAKIRLIDEIARLRLSSTALLSQG
jgi:hypothetical protein